jgi:hypothetical protein
MTLYVSLYFKHESPRCKNQLRITPKSDKQSVQLRVNRLDDFP